MWVKSEVILLNEATLPKLTQSSLSVDRIDKSLTKNDLYLDERMQFFAASQRLLNEVTHWQKYV